MRPKPRRRRKAAIFLLTPIILVGGAVGWQIFQRRDEPRLLENSPAEIKLIPRSRYQSKPWLSLTWFGGQKLQYPSETKMPPKWTDNPLSSGILYWEDPPGKVATKAAGIPPGVSRAKYFPLLLNHYVEWKTKAGEEFEFPNTGRAVGESVAFDIPYVFGNEPMLCQARFAENVGLPSVLALPDFGLEIPPLRKPPPTLRPVNKMFEHIELTFTPGRWIGPSFCTEYKVTATGLKPGEVLLLNTIFDGYGTTSAKDQPAYMPAWFRVETGKTSTFKVAAPRVRFTATIATKKPIKVRAFNPSGRVASYIETHYKDSNGTILARGYTSTVGGRAYSSIRNEHYGKKGPMAFQIGGQWIGYAYNLDSSNYISASMRLLQPQMHKPGDYDAIAYVAAKEQLLVVDGLRVPTKDLEEYVRSAR